ncbi:hypothetical protein LSCM1_05102 [Leishmania martiniquensis]|uniref:Uncharacterized protein n=1 Tax=Leishmania martiniquensis TaxID=1580590 RepID=A0A836KLU8_9TRYP|nr:hypothetical protein LSCM1_05102 [Leishmania martiniquensis]
MAMDPDGAEVVVGLHFDVSQALVFDEGMCVIHNGALFFFLETGHIVMLTAARNTLAALGSSSHRRGSRSKGVRRDKGSPAKSRSSGVTYSGADVGFTGDLERAGEGAVRGNGRDASDLVKKFTHSRTPHMCIVHRRPGDVVCLNADGAKRSVVPGATASVVNDGAGPTAVGQRNRLRPDAAVGLSLQRRRTSPRQHGSRCPWAAA